MNNNKLTDPFGRNVEYLRLSVTDRCDLRCRYCLPKGFKNFKVPEEWLTFAEIEQLVSAFASLGLKRIRLTGGEPLVRKNLMNLAERISNIPGIEDLSLSTNATQLDKQASDLKRAGIHRLNVSLDTLDRRAYEEMTGRDMLPDVLHGLQTAGELGFQRIKINMVMMKDFNDNQVDNMLAYCIENNFTLRFIEAMPMGAAGKNIRYMSLQPVIQHLKDRFDLLDSVSIDGGPARYLTSRDGKFTVGFITPISQHFCDTCNRVRLAVDGTLYLCLGQEDKYEFRQLLRSGISDAELQAAVQEAISLKPERHEFRESPDKIARLMSMTGG